MSEQQESSCRRWINVNVASLIKASKERGASVLRPISLTQETIDSEIYGGEERREEVLLAAVTPSPPLLPLWLLLLPPFLPVYRLVKRRNKQKRVQRREDIPPSPPPRYLPIFIQPFLSWRGIIPLQASEI